MKSLPFFLVACTLAAPFHAAEADPPKTETFRWGADFRARYEYYNRNAGYDQDRGFEDGHEGYFRFRTRVWGEATAGRLTGYLRLGNEFRHYFTPEGGKGKKRFPDELFVDNLWLRVEGLWDFMDVKVGRQDIDDLGARRIFGDGTPVDGSRSNFFDAARVTLNFDNKRTLDLLALSLSRHDWLPTPGSTHGGRGPDSKGYEYDYSMGAQREFGLAAYWQDRSNEALGWDAYYVWKAEHGAYSDFLAREDGDPRSFHTHTFGFRLLPRFTDRLSGELEAALQLGDDNLLAGMGYAGLTYAFSDAPWKPEVTAAVYTLTGDSDGTRGGHAWHSVFNRESTFGDVPASMYPGLDHNNLVYPHLRIAATPGAGHSLALQCGPMFAPVRERDAYGHSGALRGIYAQLLWIVNLGEAVDDRLEGFDFVFLGEALRKGNYFTEECENNLGVYLCWELMYTF